MKAITTIKVEKVKLDRGGYDQRGRYFGVGEKLWKYEWHTRKWVNGRWKEDVHYGYGHVRAPSKSEAIEEVKRSKR